jgi:hypothetical protein
MINLIGPRPREVWSEMEKAAGHGFAGQPFGNAGIQYGLQSLEQGLITPAQFVDLNAAIGGGDIDLNPTPERLSGDDAAVTNAVRAASSTFGGWVARIARSYLPSGAGDTQPRTTRSSPSSTTRKPPLSTAARICGFVDTAVTGEPTSISVEATMPPMPPAPITRILGWGFMALLPYPIATRSV